MVLRQIDHNRVAPFELADPEACKFVAADDVHEGHRGLDADALGERRVLGCRVNVIAPVVVLHELRQRLAFTQQSVRQPHHAVFVHLPETSKRAP